MLVLSRKTSETIRIGEDIIISVIQIRGDKVRIGVKADKNIPVHREEVYLAIKQAKESVNDEPAA